MRVLFYDPTHQPDPNTPPAESTDLPTLLAESDFVSLHTPLTEATHHLIGTPELQQMKPSAILVNTARGPVVDPKALYEALSSGEISAAALDVTEPEPIPPDDPLLELDNLLIAPHIASASRATRGKMADMAVENLLAGLAGERLPNCINPEVYQ
jgi:glyoxylate reductase